MLAGDLLIFDFLFLFLVEFEAIERPGDCPHGRLEVIEVGTGRCQFHDGI
jgi:hypothetical protein